MSLNWPNTRDGDFSLHNMYVVSLDLRLSHVLNMWIDLLRSHQTLLRNWVVIKVVFGFAKKHAVRHGQLRRDLPLSTWERYLWAPRVIQIKKCMAMRRLRVNQGFRITGSRKSGRLQVRPNIVRQKEQHVYDIMTARLIWSLRAYRSWHVLLEAAVYYYACKSTWAMSIRMWAHRVTHLRERSLIRMRSELDWTLVH